MLTMGHNQYRYAKFGDKEFGLILYREVLNACAQNKGT